MEKNGSPDPIFETDQDRNYFLAILPAHQGISYGAGDGSTALSFSTLEDLIKFSNRAKYLDPLLNLGWVSQDYPGEKTHPKQRYKITEAGERILKLLMQ